MKTRPFKTNLHRHKVTFRTPEQIRMLTASRLGASNKGIAMRTGMKDGQITYGLTKWNKRVKKYPKGVTERQMWRDGESEVFVEVASYIEQGTAREALEEAKQLERPQAVFSPHGKREVSRKAA